MTRWQQRLDLFAADHAADSSNSDDDPDILFLVNPASAGGKPMEPYADCLAELKATGRHVEVYISRNSDDIIGLSKTKDLSSYKAIAVLSGDSTLYELVQDPLRENNGRWPYDAPILMLPGGSVNVIATENFGAKALPRQIIRQTLNAASNNALVKKASVMHVSSETATSRYILHHGAGGISGKVLAYMEGRRADIYPTLGNIGMLFTLLFHLPFVSTNDIAGPVFFDVWNSDIEAGKDMGFGVRRFDSNMTVVTIPKDKYPGKIEIIRLLPKLISGAIAKSWKEGNAPEYLSIEKTNKHAHQVDSTRTAEGAVTTIYGDGSGKVPFVSSDAKITV
ncbi:expressed unknown protein [Seminavis robusta]|uniref:DAGKc domain-containing protein n=1 Tax=Seminavis robusta TaxID=568900 RepID=A0A9N8DM09_9STRA|nr:expressed unknown protein [Seminavis robusta]|eukprot:Sro234_g094510.1 n/a (336) ;mRNA; r:60469-61476